MKKLLVVALERNERTSSCCVGAQWKNYYSTMMAFETMYLVLSEQELDHLHPNLELDPCWEDWETSCCRLLHIYVQWQSLHVAKLVPEAPRSWIPPLALHILLIPKCHTNPQNNRNQNMKRNGKTQNPIEYETRLFFPLQKLPIKKGQQHVLFFLVPLTNKWRELITKP